MKGASPIPKVGAVLLLIVVVAGLSTIAVGPVQGALNQLGGEIEDKFGNRSPIVEVDNKEQLAGIAKVTMDRAAECEAFEAHKPYQDLSGTSLGQNPKCRILPLDTLERFDDNVASPVTGESGSDDIEGKNGRTRINFTSDIILNSEKTYGSGKSGKPINNWRDNEAKFSIVGVINGGFYSAVDGDFSQNGANYATSRFSGELDGDQQAEYTYVVAFAGNSARNRFDTTLQHRELQRVGEEVIIQNEEPGIFSNTKGTKAASAASWLDNTADGRTQLKICEGDKGYVQVNKLNPTNQALEEDTDDAGVGRTPLFGYIQITERAEDCDLLRPESIIAVSHDNSQDTYPRKMDVDSTSDVDILVEEISEKHGAPNNDDSEFPSVQPSNKFCMVAVMEKDGTTINSDWDEGHAIFPEGVKITDDGFPDTSQAADGGLYLPGEGTSDGFETIIPEGFEDSARGAYQSLTGDEGNKGFNGGTVDESVSFLEDDKLSLTGEVICGQPPDQNRAKWLTCDPDSGLDGETINAGGTQYECSGGEWSS